MRKHNVCPFLHMARGDIQNTGVLVFGMKLWINSQDMDLDYFHSNLTFNPPLDEFLNIFVNFITYKLAK